MVNDPPAVQEMQEMRVQSLGQEDPLEQGMETHSNILAWKIPWAEEPGGQGLWGHKESGTTEHTQKKNCANLTEFILSAPPQACSPTPPTFPCD